MKERYMYLKDRSNRVRVVLCLIEMSAQSSWYNEPDQMVSWGMAIRSDQDKHSVKTGKRLAKRRAVRALKERRPCYIRRDEAKKNIWSLRWIDFNRFMNITNGKLEHAPKMGTEFGKTIGKWIRENINHV